MDKIKEEYDVSDYEVLTPSGFVDIHKVFKTIEFERLTVETETGRILNCADTHILINDQHEEVHVKELNVYDKVKTIDGVERISSIVHTGIFEEMFDLEIGGDHLYYTNGFVSHNTTTVAAYLLLEAMYNPNQMIAILANKASTAREILDRIQNMFLYLPDFLKIGVDIWNKGSVKFSNGSTIFAAATSSSSIRGKSCVSGDSNICLEINDDIYYTNINSFLNFQNGDLVKKFSVYKTTNKINQKVYIGFHTTNDDFLVENYNDIGSVFKDGYLGSGKLIKKAIEKYGPENFSQEILKTFSDKKEAEEYEKELVNSEWVKKEENYNISLGGNVLILTGSDNGFYGRKHSDETVDFLKKLHEGNKHSSLAHDFKIIHVETGEVFLDYVDLNKKYNISRYNLITEIGNGRLRYSCEENQKKAMSLFNKRLSREEKSKIQSDGARLRFKGVKRTEESKKAGGESLSLWISNNKEKHQEKMKSINTNPEKIRKTAEKHKGSKRSEETRQRISEALKNSSSKKDQTKNGKNKKYVFNTTTLISKRVDSNYTLGENESWGNGNKSGPRNKKWFHNPETGEIKSSDSDEFIILGWVPGRGKWKK